VAAGVEEAQADVRRKEEKDDSAQAQAAGESEDDENGEEEVIKFAFGFPSPKRGRKLSDEEQAETMRPRSPGRLDELQGELHGDSDMALQVVEADIALTHRPMEMVDKVFHAQMRAHQVSLPLGGVPDRAPK
jgi:hypothetical protein